MNKKKKVSVYGLRREIASYRDNWPFPPCATIEDDLEETMFFFGLEKEWREEERQKDPLKALFYEKLFKRDVNELKLMATRNKEEQPKIMSRVRFLAPDKPRWEIPVDVREKMTNIDLKDFITHEWPGTKYHLNACKCCFPSHKDDSPSFHVYPQTNSFFCF